MRTVTVVKTVGILCLVLMIVHIIRRAQDTCNPQQEHFKPPRNIANIFKHLATPPPFSMPYMQTQKPKTFDDRPIRNITYRTYMQTQKPKTFDDRPIRNITYRTSGSNSDRAVFVVPRRAYYYTSRLMGPTDTFLILAEVNYNATECILACELDGHLSKSVETMTDRSVTNWIRENRPTSVYTHRVLLIRCKGFPRLQITSGSVTKLIYQKDGEDYYSRVRTEKPLVISYIVQNSFPSRGNKSVVLCTTTYGRPQYFRDWLMYQKTIGVDRVHINAAETFEENATTVYPFLKESLGNGFVHMEVWKNIVGKRLYNRGQMLKYQDCLYRHMGVFEYALFYDVDDFFNPMLPDHKDIHHYLPRSGSLCFHWKQIECKPLDDLRTTLQDGNLTRILSGPYAHWRIQRKCIHRLRSEIKIVGIHGVDQVAKGYSESTADKHFAYIAHNRFTTNLCEIL